MLKDCLEVFKRQMQQVKEKGRAEDALILDSYIPADGCYISVNSDGIIARRQNKWRGFRRDIMGKCVFLIITAG